MKNSLIPPVTAAIAAAILSFAPATAFSETVISTSGTSSIGTISEFSPDAIVIRSETATAPIRYSVGKSVTYVDEAGAPVSMEVVRSGAPVTVYYAKEGDRMIANRVVVRKTTTTTPVITTTPVVTTPVITTTTTPVIEERRTTTTTAPATVIEKRKTTTTTTSEKD